MASEIAGKFKITFSYVEFMNLIFIFVKALGFNVVPLKKKNAQTPPPPPILRRIPTQTSHLLTFIELNLNAGVSLLSFILNVDVWGLKIN